MKIIQMSKEKPVDGGQDCTHAGNFNFAAAAIV
jgi:hypothetical protein